MGGVIVFPLRVLLEEPHFGGLPPQGNLWVRPVARCLVVAIPFAGRQLPGRNHEASRRAPVTSRHASGAPIRSRRRQPVRPD
jgi:hypothetical protein